MNPHLSNLITQGKARLQVLPLWGWTNYQVQPPAGSSYGCLVGVNYYPYLTNPTGQEWNVPSGTAVPEAVSATSELQQIGYFNGQTYASILTRPQFQLFVTHTGTTNDDLGAMYPVREWHDLEFYFKDFLELHASFTKTPAAVLGAVVAAPGVYPIVQPYGPSAGNVQVELFGQGQPYLPYGLNYSQTYLGSAQATQTNQLIFAFNSPVTAGVPEASWYNYPGIIAYIVWIYEPYESVKL